MFYPVRSLNMYLEQMFQSQFRGEASQSKISEIHNIVIDKTNS